MPDIELMKRESRVFEAGANFFGLSHFPRFLTTAMPARLSRRMRGYRYLSSDLRRR
jgi:hypothetical protein